MRDYMRRKTKYVLPRTVYHQALWKIRDYYRLSEEARAIIDDSPAPPDGQPGAHGKTTDVVASKAEKREEIMDEIKKIDSALNMIPQEYRRGVWMNVHWGTRFPVDASRETYSRYKSKLIYYVAENFGLI